MKVFWQIFLRQVVEPEFLKSGSVDIEDLLNEIGQHVGPIDEEETDEELVSINKQWEKDEAALPPVHDEAVSESEPPRLLEEAPQLFEERGLVESEAPLSEESAPQFEETPQLEAEAPAVDEEAARFVEEPSALEEARTLEEEVPTPEEAEQLAEGYPKEPDTKSIEEVGVALNEWLEIPRVIFLNRI